MQTFAVHFLNILRLLTFKTWLSLNCLIHRNNVWWIFFFTWMNTLAHVWVSSVYTFAAIVILFLRLISNIMLSFWIEEFVLALLTIFTRGYTISLEWWSISMLSMLVVLFALSHHFYITMRNFPIVLRKWSIFNLR